MANRYIQSIQGFYSKVFNCYLTLVLIGTSLVEKLIVYSTYVKDVYPSLSLSNNFLTDLYPKTLRAFYENKEDFLDPFSILEKQVNI